MPSTYAHYRFGKRVLERLDGDARRIAERHRALFDIGLHGPDVLFHCRAFTHNRHLDLLWRIFAHVKTALRARDQRRAARLPRSECRRNVLAEPHRFDSHRNRRKPRNHGFYLLVYL